jgi:hypothetical protein
MKKAETHAPAVRARAPAPRARLEAEADQAVAHAARGTPADLELSATKPARDLGGTGGPLPSAVRDRLERIFAADLAAVKIHEGPDATRATRGARAVSAGAHVYLGEQDRVAAAHTFPVLVHEIAHVLQQTGRERQDGRLIATDRSGAAEPFAWSAPFKRLTRGLTTVQMLAEWSKAARARGLSTAENQILALFTALLAAPDPVVFWADRASHVVARTPDPVFVIGSGAAPTLGDLEPLARAALGDGLKLAGNTAAAAEILIDFGNTEALILDPDTYLTFVAAVGVDELLDRILKIWRDEPIFDEARPHKMIAYTVAYLTGSFSGVLGVPIHDDTVAKKRTFLADDLYKIVDAAEKAGTIHPGELVVSAIFAVVQLEQIRKKVLEPPKNYRRVITNDEVLDSRVTVAEGLVERARVVQQEASDIKAGTSKSFTGTLEAANLYVRNFAPLMGAIGAWALDFWKLGALANAAAHGASAKAIDLGLSDATLLNITASPEPFDGLKASLEKHHTDFFSRLADTSIPGAVEYGKRVSAATEVVGNQMDKIKGKVVGRASAAWSGSLFDFDAKAIPADRTETLAQAAWLLAALAGYRTILKQYVRKDDDGLRKKFEDAVGPLPDWPGDDYRIYHRAFAAERFGAIAKAIGLDTIATAMMAILSAEETLPGGGTQDDDVLVIIDRFRPQLRGPISRLSKDMEGAPLAGAEQFTAAQFVALFQADRYKRISSRIDTLLGGPEGSTFSLDHEPLLNQAISTENKSPAQPVRYRLERGRFAYLHRGAAKSGGVPRTQLRLLMQAHPVIKALVAPWDHHIIPPNQNEPDLVIWKIPTLETFAKYLRAIPAVNQLLARYAQVDAPANTTPPTADELAKLDDAAWWQKWLELTTFGVEGIEQTRRLSLQKIPEVNKKLAKYASADLPQAAPPTAAELDAMDAEEWEIWLNALVLDASPKAKNDERSLGLRKIPPLDTLIASYATADAGKKTTATSVASLTNAAWLELWHKVIDLGFTRRMELRETLGKQDLYGALSKDRTAAWEDMLDHERKALVHERVRIVKTLVEPLLKAYVAETQITDIVKVGQQRTPKRWAAGVAIDNLTSQLLAPIDDNHWLKDPKVKPQERESHQAAALLEVAYLARDKIVTNDSGWIMIGWDRDVAWMWMPILERTLKFLDTKPDLTLWLRDDEQPASSWVPDRKAALENIYEGLWKSMNAHREDFGFVGVKGDGTIENPGSVHEVKDSARKFGIGHEFTIDGVTWEILSVPEKFTYHPALLKGQTEVMPPKLVINGSEDKTFDGKTTLVRVMRDGEFLELNNDRGPSEPYLRELSFAVMMASTVEQLMELAEGMEAGARFAMGLALDIAELFPVAGQAAAAARVVLTIGSVLADEDFRNLVSALIVDPVGVVKDAWEKFSSNLKVEKIAENLLIEPGLEFLEDLGNLKKPHKRVGAAPSGVGKILRRLASIARSIAGAIGRVIGFAHDIRDDLQAFVLEHLLLARVLSFVAEHIHFIAEIPKLIQTESLESLEDSVIKLVRGQFVGMVEAIGEIRMPAKLITMRDVVPIFLDIVGKRLGGKYAFGYKVIKALLEAVGRWTEVTDMISDALDAIIPSDINPLELQTFWTDFVNEQLGKHLGSVQGWVRDMLDTVYSAIPWHSDHLPKPGKLNIKTEGDQFLDAAPLARPGATSVARPEEVELSSGRRLSGPQRARFESQLGQDLSHVRVHTGGDASRATTAAGARALTTGSHVLLAPDVAVGSDSGDRVMRHELVHVLQQTGPRAAGADDTPITGEPNLGVNIHPAAEKLANEISAQAAPTDVRPSPARGFQPSMFGMGQRFVDYLTHTDRAWKEIEKIEKTEGGTGRKLIGKDVKHDVEKVAAALESWIDNFTAKNIDSSVSKNLAPVADKIKDWLVAKKKDIKNAVDDLAIDASSAKALRNDSNESPIMELHVEGFEAKLVRFIVVATGCDIKIELNTTAHKLDHDKPLKKAILEGMNPAAIPHTGAGKALWDELMDNSFGAGSNSDVMLRANARIFLFALGFTNKPWDKTGFKLDDAYVKTIRGSAKATAKSSAQFGDLPDAKTFWHGSAAPANKDQPALWIGLHKDATHHSKPDRQSHHTTQFLLVQYFEQDHYMHKPFPEMRGAVATTFANKMKFSLAGKKVNAVDDIKVGTLDTTKHRGGDMPAILVSALMHRRGNLHINKVPESDEDDEATMTQGGRLDDWFHQELEKALPKKTAGDYWAAKEAVNTLSDPTTSNTQKPDPTLTPLDWLVANAPQLAIAIPAAMRGAYARMADIMIPAIEPGLKYLETTWYEQLAAAQNKSTRPNGDHHVTSDMISKVAKAAIANNTSVMETDSNWKK